MLTQSRITKSTLEEMEERYHDSLEKIALLEAELSAQNDTKIELQRTKDELRETTEELAVATGKLGTLTANNHSQDHASQTSPLASRKDSRPSDLHRKSSRLAFYHHNNGIPENSTVPSGKLEPLGAPYSTRLHTKPPRITASRSLRKIHGMLDQMKSLETRVANFKSSLPKPITSSTTLATQLPLSPASRPSSTIPRQIPVEHMPLNEIPRSPPSSAISNASNIPVPRSRMSSDQLPRTYKDQYPEEYRKKRQSMTADMFGSARPVSPFNSVDDYTRSTGRSLASSYSPSKSHSTHSSIDGSLNLLAHESPDWHKRRDGKNGVSRHSSVETRSPRLRHSVDVISFAGFNIGDSGHSQGVTSAPVPHPSAALLYSHSNRSNGNMGGGPLHPANHTNLNHYNKQSKPRSKPSLTGFDVPFNSATNNPFPHPPHHSNNSTLNLPTPAAPGITTAAATSKPGSTFGMLHSRQPLGHGRMV